MASANNQIPLQMSSSGAEVFKKAVKYILTEWPSLNYAIENGMGGSQSNQKRDWMCNIVAESFLKDNNLDVEDFLAELINQEFDTLIEDGSLEYNTQWINKFYKDCIQGKDQEVMNSINQAAQKKISLGNLKIPPPICQNQDESSDDEDEDDEDLCDNQG